MDRIFLASWTRPLLYGFAIYASLSPIFYFLIHPLFSHGHKIFFYGTMSIMLITIIINRAVLKDNLVIFLLIYSGFLIALGLSLNEINKATFAHIQVIILPILGINFGYLIAANRPDILRKIYNGANQLGYILSAIILAYFLLYQLGFIPYFGASSLLFIPIFWAFLEKKWLHFLFFVCILLLTGKRTPLLAISAVLIISTLRHLNLKQVLAICGLTTVTWVLYGYFSDNFMILFKRFTGIYEVLVSGDLNLSNLSVESLAALDAATSGRINDIIAPVSSLTQNPILWLTGRGIGGVFEVILPNTSRVWVTHYSHFTPIAYCFLGGVIMFLAIYGKLVILLLHCIKKISNFYSMFFIYYFISSVSGASYFSDPFIWMVVGVIVYRRKFYGVITKQKNNFREDYLRN